MTENATNSIAALPETTSENIESNLSESERLPAEAVNSPISTDHTDEKFNGVEISKLTKRQLKKYHKFQQWQQVKKEKRNKEKQKSKEKRKHAKLNNIDLGPSRKELKRKTMEASPCQTAVCIDLSFDYLMIDKVKWVIRRKPQT